MFNEVDLHSRDKDPPTNIDGAEVLEHQIYNSADVIRRVMQSRRNIPCPIAMGNPDPELVERVTRREREREARRKAKDNERLCLLLGRELPPSRLGNQQWCSCGSCKSFTRIRENVCCREALEEGQGTEASRGLREKLKDGGQCIVQHPSFHKVVLDPETLRVLLVNLRVERKKANAPVEDENRRDSFRRGLLQGAIYKQHDVAYFDDNITLND
ncbi:hypothetical protein COOONC_12467 [Cooperia oncophora]